MLGDLVELDPRRYVHRTGPGSALIARLGGSVGLSTRIPAAVDELFERISGGEHEDAPEVLHAEPNAETAGSHFHVRRENPPHPALFAASDVLELDDDTADDSGRNVVDEGADHAADEAGDGAHHQAEDDSHEAATEHEFGTLHAAHVA